MEDKNYPWVYKSSDGKRHINRQQLYCHLKRHLKMKITDAGNIYLLNDNNLLFCKLSAHRTGFFADTCYNAARRY